MTTIPGDPANTFARGKVYRRGRLKRKAASNHPAAGFFAPKSPPPLVAGGADA